MPLEMTLLSLLGNTLLCMLSLCLSLLDESAGRSSIEDSLSILVQLELDNNYVGRMNSDKNCGTVRLLSCDPFDMNYVFASVGLNYLTDGLTLEVAANNLIPLTMRK